MDILNSLVQILEDNDKRHRMSVTISDLCFIVELYYDPENNYDDSVAIPIRYNPYENWGFIPQDEFIDTYQCSDFGIDDEEIDLIDKILKCLKDHNSEVEKICRSFSLDDRAEPSAND